ncbi:MAG: hypothetical protein QOH56_2790 [Pseudonocardiales bacterium]|nr:hypothetical protein [Pseudonocardiales bacterium]
MTHSQSVATEIPKAVLRPRTERLVWVMFGVVVVIAMVVAFLFVKLGQANNTAHSADKAGKANAAGLASANSKLIKAGEAPVPTPTSPGAVTVTVTAPPPAVVGPSNLQVSAAVAVYCAQHSGCASGPTAAQVAQAVATYCTSNGQCKGPVGKSGAPGAPGSAGSSGAPGRDGQNATPDQVAAAVTSYCSTRNNCQGPAGSTGAAGADGVAGYPPLGFTFTITSPLGDTNYSCTPDSPPAAGTQPHYSCTKE